MAARALQPRVHHLLLAGHNSLSPPIEYASRSAQSPGNPVLTPVPLPLWLGSIGRAKDVDAGFAIRAVSSANGHSLIHYDSEHVHRVFSSGRNEVGQLGVGYNSQESTRQLVENFKGESIAQIATGVQSSYLLLNNHDDTSLYVMGSLQRGRLGQPRFYAPSLEAGEEDPKVHQLSQATLVELPAEIKSVSQLAVGYEHALIVTNTGSLYGTGANTDGQLGLGGEFPNDAYEFKRIALPDEVLAEGIATIRAGADTSALITHAGNLWTWGNSEYGQAMHGQKVDQVLRPTRVDTSSFLPPSRRVIDYRCGGAFALLMDSRGSVYSAGFGAIGLGPQHLESSFVQRVETLEGEGITRIRAGWGWAAAVRDDGVDSAIFTWGLNSSDGRLGVGSVPSRTLPTPATPARPQPQLASDKRSLKGIRESSSIEIPMHIHLPTQIVLPLPALGLLGVEGRGTTSALEWDVGEVECGQDELWVSLIAESAELPDGIVVQRDY